jgi:hypothetical protein
MKGNIMKRLVLALACVLCMNVIAAKNYQDTEEDVYDDSDASYAQSYKQDYTYHQKECCCNWQTDYNNKYFYDWTFELKQGYFHPQDKLLRNMFKFRGSKGGYMVEGDVRWRFWKGFNLELNGGYFSHKGSALVTSMVSSTTNCCCDPCGMSCNSCNVTCNSNCCSSCDCNYRAGECIKYKLGTVGLSLKYYFELCRHDWLVPYLGGGLKLFLVSINNDSLYVKQCEHYKKLGGAIHAGLLFRICRGFFADLFVDYLGRSIKCGNNCDSCRSDCSTNCGSCCQTTCNTDREKCCNGKSGKDNGLRLKIGGVFAGVGIGYAF